MDYGFMKLQNARESCDLEGLWGDAARVKSKSKPAKVKLTSR
jgi:hypothetical protein